MVCSGVYLYYGYKVQEDELRGIFEADYIIYCNEQHKKIHKKAPKKAPKYEYEFDGYSFRTYIDKCFVDLGAKDIIATTLPCCKYKKGGYWIVGKEIAHIDGFDMSEIILPTSADFKQIDLILEKTMSDSGLSKVINDDILPKIYAIANDCMSCT